MFPIFHNFGSIPPDELETCCHIVIVLCVEKLMISGQIVLINEINYSYLYVESGVVCPQGHCLCCCIDNDMALLFMVKYVLKFHIYLPSNIGSTDR